MRHVGIITGSISLAVVIVIAVLSIVLVVIYRNKGIIIMLI